MEGQVTSRSLAIVGDIRKIRIYRNGDENYFGKELVFNRKQVRDFDQLLQTVTHHVELDRAARSIHTPRYGHRVDDVDGILDRAAYVVVGNGKFKKIEYEQLFDRHVAKLRDDKKRSEEMRIRMPLKPVESNRYHVTGRIRDAMLDVMPIYVYRNGDERDPAKRIILTRRMMTHWALILNEISQHVQPQFSAVQYLCSLDGERVVHKSDLKAGKYYVAVGYKTPFRRLSYGDVDHKPAFQVSPRYIQRNLTIGVFHRPKKNAILSEDESFADNSSSIVPHRRTQSDPVTTSKRRSRIISRLGFQQRSGGANSDNADLFHVRPRGPYRLKEPLPAIRDRDDPVGPFKANEVRQETKGARQVADSPETNTDLPIDMQRAQQVEEDEVHEDHTTRTHHNISRSSEVIKNKTDNSKHQKELQKRESQPYRVTMTTHDETGRTSESSSHEVNEDVHSHRMHFDERQNHTADSSSKHANRRLTSSGHRQAIDENTAATKIEAVFRGYRVRKVKRNKPDLASPP